MIFVLIIFLLIYFFHTTKKEENVVLLGVECEITDVNTSDRIKINIDEKQLQNNNEFLKVTQIELLNKN